MSRGVIDLTGETDQSPAPAKTPHSRFGSWWRKIVIIRVKALVYLASVLLILVTAFQIQNVQLNDQRIKDVSDRQDQVCLTRIQTRKDLRQVLFYVVDLSDVLPGVDAAEQFTINRTAFINEKYPEISKSNC